MSKKKPKKVHSNLYNLEARNLRSTGEKGFFLE